MNFQHLSRRKITLLVTLVVVIIGGLIAWRLTRDPFQAAGDPITAEVFVHISRADQPRSGVLDIQGDCVDNPAAAVNGAYYCKLMAPDEKATLLNIYSLTYYETDSETAITIPIRGVNYVAIEPSPLTLAANDELVLDVTFGTDGKPTVQKWDEEQSKFVSFPP